ncbi:sphingomyelin synthase 2, putative [Plasmodium berghei]|uniref:Sphingomyelin synthase 2, putative n=2 Tax=Plasmodium berghei TaxID=5821 RepID=A0A509ASM8_PLABA|nr:sphingomyelin synthase 2, putative [Plasmodium berghei ANKA]CXI64839.1 sphingomyelin synthase 2, putative [Plasmodium berghei]SCM23903.1 sphingomyelin synthase 2, putative [Plasmodium berghei]SCN26830.1 sphingomyelin synthase 2, putative [Plasmodium berghei]SCO61203.1 sphingomyelin synthase 2, putative [Plasmodium berghei]SCO63250.1 sphingomyelin synthase 2, putative [Plasmodium berghei]|eukprot:XP_034422447.1 sphingomyelin synthase 2, putative [Plasmodium berghei ANKA]
MEIPKFNKEDDRPKSENDKNSNYIINGNCQINKDIELNEMPVKKDEDINNSNCLTEWKLFKILFTKLMISFSFFIISLFIQSFFMIYSDSYYKRYTIPLSDRVHELVGHPPKWVTYNLSNSLVGLLSITFIQLILFNSIYLSIAIICRFLYMHGFFYILRGILIYITSLPATLKTCIPLERGNIGFNLLQVVKLNFNLLYVCSDLIVSGHSFTSTIFLLFIFCYMDNVVIKVITALLSCFVYSVLIVGFIHYTSDVLLGILFGFFIFGLYHIALDLSSLHYIISTLYDVRSISNNKENNKFEAKPFFLRCFLLRILLGIIPRLEGLHHTLDYAMNRNSNKSEFCNCEHNSSTHSRSIDLFKRPHIKEKLLFGHSNHLYHAYAGDGKHNFLLFKFFGPHPKE